MIGIETYDEDEIAKFLPRLGLGRHKVIFNPRTLDGLSVLVMVGGHAVRTNHCYIQRESTIPIIQCLDPKTIQAEPVNRFWIETALRKAHYIDTHGDNETSIQATIKPTLKQVTDFFSSWPIGPISIDLETDRHTFEILVIGIAFERNEGVESISIPLIVGESNYWSEDDELEIWRLVAAVLAGPHDKVFQNFIFDTMHLARNNLPVNGRIFDTMVINHWIDPELPKGLADLGRLYLMCDVWKGRDNWASNESLWLYNAKDAGYTLIVLERQLERLRKENRINFITDQLVPLSNEVLALCSRGWRLDSTALADMRSSLENQALSIRKTLETFALDLVRPKVTYIQRKGKPKAGTEYWIRRDNGSIRGYERAKLPDGLKKLSSLPEPVFEKIVEERHYNPQSPAHDKEVLRSLGIKLPLYKGAESTNEDSLLRLLERKSVPDEIKDLFIKPLLDHRGLAKLINTYCDVQLDPDGVCRFVYVISGDKSEDDQKGGGTLLSRFSSKETPWGTGFNAQNLPKSFRKVIVPFEKENVIINLDFKQADPHMVAWLSGEEQMLAILNDPKGDLHAHTASKIFGYDITLKEGYKDSFERKLGKACNNGLNYGMQPLKFIETCRKQGLTLDLPAAIQAHSAYFKAYPKIRLWQEKIRQQIIQTRVLTTPHGRRRFFYGHLNDKLINDALAYIPPTTVSDAINELWLRLKDVNPQLIVFSQTHDSLGFEVPATKVDEFCTMMHNEAKKVLFTVNGRICNFPIDLEIGKSWGQLTKWIP